MSFLKNNVFLKTFKKNLGAEKQLGNGGKSYLLCLPHSSPTKADTMRDLQLFALGTMNLR